MSFAWRIDIRTRNKGRPTLDCVCLGTCRDKHLVTSALRSGYVHPFKVEVGDTVLFLLNLNAS